MIAPLLLAAALGAQAAPPEAPAPPGRFVVCPGNRRCPARPSTQHRGDAGPPANPMIDALLGQMIAYGPRRDPDGGRPVILDFVAGDAGLSEASRALLDDVARRMAAAPDREVLLEGHADAGGSEAANVALAGRRAVAAADYLVGRGVAADRILTISWDEAGEAGTTGAGSLVATVRRRAEGRAP